MNWDNQIIDEWRKLGFYYHLDDDLKQWWIIGSPIGLSNFAKHLSKYSNNISKKEISEHIHLGPHQYLKIMTWHVPLISKDAIGGTLADIRNLKNILANKLSNAKIGETFEIGSDYANVSEYKIRFFVMADNFDPASIELK